MTSQFSRVLFLVHLLSYNVVDKQLHLLLRSASRCFLSKFGQHGIFLKGTDRISVGSFNTRVGRDKK